MRPSTLDQLKRHLRPGRVYRREDLLPWSHSVDRHLKELTDDGTLQKLRTGLYYSPRKFEFGEAPADEHELVKAFLKTDRFVLTSPNAYNQLGLGTTQLYNKRVVYNQKGGHPGQGEPPLGGTALPGVDLAHASDGGGHLVLAAAQVPGLAVIDDLGFRAVGERQDRHGCRQCFGHHQAERFGPGDRVEQGGGMTHQFHPGGRTCWSKQARSAGSRIFADMTSCHPACRATYTA